MARQAFPHEGKFWHVRDVEVLPQPAQRPSPLFWTAATSPEAVTTAAAMGHSILQDPHSSHAEIGAKRASYERRCDTAFLWKGAIADRASARHRQDARAAIATAREGAQWTIDSCPRPQVDGVDPIESYLRDTIIYGTPEEVTDKLTELRETIGLDYLIASPLSHETFMLLTERVLPKLAS